MKIIAFVLAAALNWLTIAPAYANEIPVCETETLAEVLNVVTENGLIFKEYSTDLEVKNFIAALEKAGFGTAPELANRIKHVIIVTNSPMFLAAGFDSNQCEIIAGQFSAQVMLEVLRYMSENSI